MDTRTDGHTLTDKPRTNATATFMHPAGPPRPGTVPWEHCGAGDRCSPRPGGPQLPSPCLGTRELGGTRAQPWGHREGGSGALHGPSTAAQVGGPGPPCLLSLPTARSHPQHSRATGWGQSASGWGLPDCLGEPPVLRGGPHTPCRSTGPPSSTRGVGGSMLCPPGRPQAALHPRDRTPVLQGTGWGRTLLYQRGCWGGAHAGQAQPRGHHRVQDPASAAPLTADGAGAICPS